MNDDSMIKLLAKMQMDYSSAIKSTEDFENSMKSLNDEIDKLKANALQSAKDTNSAFMSSMSNKDIRNAYAQMHKENKPIEVKVVTDKAEKAMIDFSRSMGIKLNKEMKENFSGLADSMMGEFDQSKFDTLANNISEAYKNANRKHSRRMEKQDFLNSEDMRFYEELRSTTMRIGTEFTDAKNNIDGFSDAIRNVVKVSNESGRSMDELYMHFKSLGFKELGQDEMEFAEKIVQVVERVRDVRQGFTPITDQIDPAEIDRFVQEQLAQLLISLGKIQDESKQTGVELSNIGNVIPDRPLDALEQAYKSLGGTIKDMAGVSKQEWENANGEVVKYTETLQNLERSLNITDIYTRNEDGGFDYSGRIINDKSVEFDTRAMAKVHEEAIKLNVAYDENIKKMRQMASDDYWKKQFQSVSSSSEELKKMNSYYSDLEKQGKATLKNIQQSTLEKMKAQAATIQQRATSKELGQEYIQQSGTIREQLSLIQARLQSEGQLTAEEVRQTQELKEQLDILNAQSRADAHDKSRTDSPPTPNEYQDKASWFTDGAKFYAVSRAAKEATETIKHVEMGMIDIQRVMSDSSFVFEDYRDKLLQLGVDYGQTFENAQNIALRWAQSGYNVADSLELTETSLLALNAAELDAKNATESLIGIMAQWNLEASELELLMDKINKTADTHSATSQDLVDGLLRSSGAARTMNLSIEETLALLVNMREASGRTGKEVGNALNSIISYMQRPSAIKAIEGAGISMFADETKTQFRSVIDIFEDMSVQWNAVGDDLSKGFLESADSAEFFNEELAVSLGLQEEWNDLQKRDVSQAAAGVHRRNFLIGLMERMTNVQGSLNGMMDAGGYSMEKNAQSMETLEKKQESLKTSVVALQVAMGDAGLGDALKAIADGGTNAINIINSMPKPMKDLTLSAMSVFTAVKTLEWGMKTFGIQIPGISQSIGSLTNGTISLTTAFKAGATGVSTFVKTNAGLLALSAAVGTIMAVTNAVKKQREETEKSIEVFKEQEQTSKAIDELIPKYEQLASKTKLTTDENQELLNIKQQITDLLPGTKSALDNENMSLETQLQIIKDLNEEELERARSKARSTLEKHEGKYDYYQKEVEEATRGLEEQTTKYEELYRRRNSLTKQEQMEMKNSRLLIDAQSERLEVNRDRIKAVDAARELYNKSLENSNALLDENTNITDDNTDSNNINADSKDSQTEATEKLIESFNDSTSTLQSYYSMLDEVNSKEGLSAKSKQEIVNKHHALLPFLNDEAELRKQLIEIITLEEKTQQEAYAKMLESSEEFYNTRIKGNTELVESLNDYYNTDFNNFKSLADAKAQVEMQLISKLSGLWQKYYQGAKINPQAEANLRKMVGMQVGDWQNAKATLDALDSYRALEDHFSSLTLNLDNIDFKGINTSGIKSPSGSKKDTKYENKELNNALKILEHRKKLSEETQSTLKAEIDELKRINNKYVKTEEERMSMLERIYAAEKRLRDRMFSDSSKWISDKKALDELSVEEEIQAWERVRNTHINNIEYRKQAELNLYKLRNQVMADSFNKEENSIKHLTKLGILNIEEQIEKYRELYEVKAKDYKEEQARIENLFDLYKKQISDQQRTIKETHDNRIKQIEEESRSRIKQLENESSFRKKMQEDIIKGIEKELDLLNKQEQEYDHDKKMADLHEQLAYWEVRTSEDARKKVIELKKQIDEANHKREVQLQKDSLEEKKQNAQDEIRNEEDKLKEKIEDIEKATKREVELAENSYKEIEIAFDEHSIDMIALASTMSEGMFDEFKKNYLIPLENALRNADYGTVDSILGGIDDFAKDSIDKTYNSNNAQIYRLANQILDLKRQYEYGGDKSASDKAKSIYSQLEKLNPSVADTLHQSNYEQAKKYIEGLPTMHTGGKTLSYGAVYMKPGELVFPPDLSTKLETLISVLYQRPSISPSRSFADNRKETRIGTLLNVENMHMEDDIDGEILSRELQRQISRIG